MTEGFRFMSLGLVRLRTFRRSRARGANESLRDVTIAQMGNGAIKCE